MDPSIHRAAGLVIPMPRRPLILTQAEVFADSNGGERLVAFLTATMMAIEGREGIVD